MADLYTQNRASSAADALNRAERAQQNAEKLALRGRATSFDRSLYNIDHMMYPSDLMDPTSPYGNNYVIFYVNVHEDSSLFKDNKVPHIDGDIPPRAAGELAGKKYSDEGVKKTAIGAATATGTTAGAVLSTAGVGNIASNAITGAALSGALAAAVVTDIGNVKAEYKRIAHAIALHIPQDMNISYGVQWGTTDTAGAAAVFGLGTNAIQAIHDMSNNSNTSIDSLKAGLSGAKSYITGATLDNSGSVGKALSKMSGIASNPKKEQIFDQVDYRTFNFSYQFFPRTPQEALQIKNIIYLFKLHMHPEYKSGSDSFLYLYPSEFDIFYYNNGIENLNLHRHTSCVLTNMTVNYTPSGTFNAFIDGMPSQINITLTFRELGLLSKELIEDGY